MPDDNFLEAVQPIARHNSLGEKAYEQMKDGIIRGAFPTNKKMTLRAIGTALGVSTTPARDAVNRLLAEGALINVGLKTVVLPALTLDVLDELTETRIALEGLAAEKSVNGITPADIDELARLQGLINKGLDRKRFKDVLQANRQFHFLIYQRSNWPRLVSMIESLWLRAGPSLLDLYPEFAQNRRGVSNHMAMIDALKRKDAPKVRAAIEQDLRDGYERLKTAIEERDRKTAADAAG